MSASLLSRRATTISGAPKLQLLSRPIARSTSLTPEQPLSSSTRLFSQRARNMSNTKGHQSLSIHNINPYVKEAKYAVRGELATRSAKYRDDLKQGEQAHLPFDQVIAANIGNPQQLDQKPITFFRQVLSLLEYPPLLEKENVLLEHLGYKSDVIARAKWLLENVQSVGAYSDSTGAKGIRESVAAFIERRDGFPAKAEDIYLSAGASSGVNTLLNVICDGPKTGILVPIPQYPLYTASLALLNATCVPYLLSESRGWGTDLEAIKTAHEKAVSDGVEVRAIVIINPGNPTGASLSEEDVEAVIDFAAEEKLVVMADEVYQTNVFKGKFHSFKRALRTLQKKDAVKYKDVELASLHSTSKGMVGECGHRGGYFELCGFDPLVQDQIYKFVSISLCSPVIGQCLVELMVNPPKEGEPSYELYKKEYDGIFTGLQERATALFEAFKDMEGVECGEPQGSMYLFPTITLSPKAIEAAKKEKRVPDEFYASRLLDATGVCVVPGSGFGQKENTFHFRTTFLAPGTEWVGRIARFHSEFMDEFR
ncbi:aminotransferase class I and II [Phlyctema vagabunda]|uniref:Aminotransferase class I and II n=1 Tax=Phlyctema vagabunda TaxID=108571 RepID=A0ABR4PFI3_9HELO